MWGDFPISTFMGIAAAVSVVCYFVGKWWDNRK